MAPNKGPPSLMPNAHCLAIAQRNQEQSQLLHLPAELRTSIYDLALDTDSDKILHDDYPDWDRLNLSRTCRQIFTETAQLHLESKMLPISNKAGIRFFGATGLSRVVQALTPSQRNCVTTVLSECWQALSVGGFNYEVLRDLPNLKVFVLRDHCSEVLPGGYLKSYVEREMGPWTNARLRIYEWPHEALLLE